MTNMITASVDRGMVKAAYGSRNRAALPRDLVTGLLLGILALTIFCAKAANAQRLVQNRIGSPIRSSQWSPLRGTVHPMPAQSRDIGQLNGSTAIHGMSLIFRRSAAQEADLENLLREQQTKGSPMYHRWLKPGEFAARYGVSPGDLAKVAGWLRSQGFRIDAIPANHDRIDFSGTAAQVDAAFHTSLHRYMFRGQPHWANATDVNVPQAIAAMTLRIAHLNTFRPRPHVTRMPVTPPLRRVAGVPQPRYTLQGQNGEINLLTPADIATIYDVNGLYNSGTTGSSETIAVAGQTDILQYESDVANFRKLSGLDASNLPQQILVPNTGAATVYPSDLEEADIDVEWAGAVAKDAQILYVTVGNDLTKSVFDSMEYAIETPLLNRGTQFVPIISISYGNCEQAFSRSQIQGVEQYLEQASAQGQTVVAASGDSGSADCDNNSTGMASNGLAVDYPASSPHVTGVGGTSFSGDLNDQSRYWNGGNDSNYGSAIEYIPETVWNNTPDQAGLTYAGALSAGGGGSSQVFSKPSWQTGLGDGHRDVPDISLASDPGHDGYVLCTEQTDGSGNFTTNPPTSTCVYPVGSHQVAYFPASGSGYLYGGTSVAAPQIAAMIALWNQKAGDTNGVGNANPILYLEAKNSPGAIHDVTTGSNAVVCRQGSPNCVASQLGGYAMSCCSAGPGYDEATGLGTVDAAAMAAVWPTLSQVNASFSLLPNPLTISVSRGSSTSAVLTLNPDVAFNGTVNLSCSNLPAGITCGFANSAGETETSVNLTAGQQQTVTLTISAASSAAATTTASRSAPTSPISNWPMPVAFAGVFGLSLAGIRKRHRFPRRWMTVCLLASATWIAAASLTACSTGSPGTGGGTGPSIQQAITVTGTSGSAIASSVVDLTVS